MEIIKQILKKILAAIHILVFIFSIVGFIMPEPFLFYFLFVWPAIYLHWQINDNNCILSDLEHYYIDGKKPPSGNKYEFPFLQKQFANAGIKLKHLDIYNFFIYGLTTFWIIGLIRYIYTRNNKKKLNNI
jgi:hypothetical protein